MDLLLQADKALKVRAASLSEHLDDLVEFGLVKAELEHLQVGGAHVPVLDFIKRARVVMARLRGVLVGDKLLDLTCPEDDDRLKALEQVLVLDSCVDIVQVFIRDVQVLHTLGNIARLSDDSHEVVKVEDELLLHILGPVSLAKELGAGFVHHGEQLVERITITDATNDDIIDVVHRDLLIELALDEVCHLVILDQYFGL